MFRADDRRRGAARQGARLSTPLWDLLLEFKLVKPEELGADAARPDVLERSALAEAPPVAAALAAAEAQARRYRAGVLARYGDTLRLRCWAVVAVGFVRLVAREVPASRGIESG